MPLPFHFGASTNILVVEIQKPSNKGVYGLVFHP